MKITQQLTMTTQEIAELTEKRHDHVMRDTRVMLEELYGEEGLPTFGDTYTNPQNNQKYPMFVLPKRETMILISGYNLTMRARIIDRWQELEAKEQKNQIVLPDFTDPVEAATAWIEQYKEKQVALKQLELAAPKVQFVDDYVDTTGSKSFREVANIFKANERKFRKFLQEHGMMYQKKNKDWAAYSKFIDKKMLQHKIIVNQDTGRSYTLVYFTPLGIEYTAKKWNEYLVSQSK